MKPKLSIVIPMYNVEKYIEKCLNSIFQLKMDSSHYEIIIIDDESPDSSLTLAKKATHNHENVTIISQKNKGLGGARNTGIGACSGIFILFLDADDYVSSSTLIDVVNFAIDKDVDVLEFAANRVNSVYSYIDTIFEIDSKSVVSGNDYIERFDFGNSACNKLYKRNFLLQNKIVFIEKTYVEDAPFNIEVFTKAQKVYAIPEVLVAFFQNSDSITRTKRTGTVLNKYIFDAYKVTVIMNNLISKSIVSAHAKNILLKKISFFTSGLLLMVLKSNKSFKQKKEILNDLISVDLYPIKVKTNVLIRDFFILMVNHKIILTFFLYMTSFKINK